MPKCVGKIATLSEDEQSLILDALVIYRENREANGDMEDIALIDQLSTRIEGPLDEWYE